jgi:glutathione peroxidase-family protein
MRGIRRARERGTILIVIVFLATAIAGLAALSSGRVVTEARHQTVLEQESRAYNEAYAKIQMALNVVNTSAYNDENQNIELLDAIGGKHGGTVAGEEQAAQEWLRDPEGVLHGKIDGTDVRVYRAREYIKRLAQLKGHDLTDVDPAGLSQSYYVLEADGRAGETTRMISALVRENEPFSSFVFFQNRHTLGVSGAPRGLIHSNDSLSFYFPNGNYVDSVSAVNGFKYEAGATSGNTNIATGNPEAQQISLDEVNFDDLKAKAASFRGEPGLDAEIKLFANGTARVRQYTPPRYDTVTRTSTTQVLTGYETQTVTQQQQVQVGTTQEQRTRQVVSGYNTETYTVTVPVYETQTVTLTRQDPVYEWRTVERTRQVPVYTTVTTTCTRQVRVFRPYDDGAGGGTAVGGGGTGLAGEYVWVTEQYPCDQQVVTGYTTETYTTTERVQVGTTTVTYTQQQQVQVGTTTETRTRQVPIYVTETYTVDVPVYELRDVQVQQQVPIYNTVVNTWTEKVYVAPVLMSTTTVSFGDVANTMYIDGRITKLDGDLNGRLTIVGNEKVRVTGNLRYVDDAGRTAMLNGGDYTKPYQRNEQYKGNSVLGIIARDDVLLTNGMPTQAEVNATMLSASGRVGIDGFQIDTSGEPIKDVYFGLTAEEKEREQAYDQTSYRSSAFKKDSLRRLGGIVSNDRILETYIKPRSDGTSAVDAGFKRGNMRFDFNLLFNPPPNFVNVPRPVAISIAPVYFVRGGQDE